VRELASVSVSEDAEPFAVRRITSERSTHQPAWSTMGVEKTKIRKACGAGSLASQNGKRLSTSPHFGLDFDTRFQLIK